MGDNGGCVGKWALDIANGLISVFLLNEAADLE